MKKSFWLTALIGLGSQVIGAEENAPMNVIFILCDDMGYGDLGCYGQPYIQTPHLDRMAREGMQFMQHYAGCPVSAPSRCSIMTGLHTGHAQIRGNKEIRPEGQEPMGKDTYTIARLMQNAGYRTGLFGKWGLGMPGAESTPTRWASTSFSVIIASARRTPIIRIICGRTSSGWRSRRIETRGIRLIRKT